MKTNGTKVQGKKGTNVRLIELFILLYGVLINALGFISPALASEWATRVFLSTRRSRRRSEEEKLLQGAQRSYRRQGAQRVAFYSWGEGPAVLLVHGWNGRGTQLHTLIPPLLESGYRVVAFDAVGHGDSDGKQSTLFKMADGIELAHREEGPFHAIVTHSMGGAATTIALRNGVRTKRLVYLSPPYNPPGWLDRFARALKISERVRFRMQQNFEAQYGKRWRILQDPKLVHVMQQPLLVIHDADDREVPSREGETLAAHWPGAVYQQTQGLGHNRILHHPRVVREAVEFVQGKPVSKDNNYRKGESDENLPSSYVGKVRGTALAEVPA